MTATAFSNLSLDAKRKAMAAADDKAWIIAVYGTPEQKQRYLALVSEKHRLAAQMTSALALAKLDPSTEGRAEKESKACAAFYDSPVVAEMEAMGVLVHVRPPVRPVGSEPVRVTGTCAAVATAALQRCLK